MLKEFFLLTLKAIRYRPIRSWLTVIGVVIGVILVVTILSLGSGIRNVVSNMLAMFGSDYIIVYPGEETNPFASILGGQKFREKDILDLATINGVRLVLPMDVASVNADYLGEKKTIMIKAGPWKEFKEFFETSQGIKLEAGFWPTDDQAAEIVLGYLVAHGTFKTDVKVGDEVILKAKRMRVSGIVSRIGVQDDDTSVYSSLSMLRALTGSAPGAVTAMIKVYPDANIELVARQVKFKLSQQEVVRDFAVLTPEKADRLVESILSMIELVFMAIGLISLVVGAVGIMNSTYTSVLERTKQIGIMKAVGASNEAILSLFLIESGMIGLVGGFVGILLGIGLSALVGFGATFAGVNGLFSFAALDFAGLFAILMFTFIVGVISGILPARQAAKMDPAAALRYE